MKKVEVLYNNDRNDYYAVMDNINRYFNKGYYITLVLPPSVKNIYDIKVGAKPAAIFHRVVVRSSPDEQDLVLKDRNIGP